MATAGKSAVVLETPAREFLSALAESGGPAIYDLSVEDARAVLDGAQSGNPERPDAEISDAMLETPVGEVGVSIYRSSSLDPMPPVTLFIHGGGWILGNQGTHDRLVRELALASGTAVAFVHYTPSPEAQHPVAIEQAYAAAAWIAEHGSQLDLDGSRLAVAGDSVGGNMSAVVALLASRRGAPAIGQQVLFYPVTDADFDTGSYGRFAEGYFLTREAMRWFWDAYAPDHATRMDPTASPLRASLDELAGLPPTLVVTGEADVLRDEGEAYAARLREAGVSVTAVRYGGIIHDFVMLDALRDSNAARAAIAQAGRVLERRWAG